MEKMKLETPDLTAQNIEKIGALFPNCVTETVDENGKQKKAINFDMLRQMLSSDVVEGDEAYEFTWVGKKAAIVEANKPIRKTLRPCPEESKDWDTTENLYIEGDNLEVLKLLQESYLSKIKIIYIDPPYNTGSDSFVYPDSFIMDKEEYEDEIGLWGDDGERLFRENNLTNPRFHSVWCSMMYSRLMLSRNLLSDDGVIFLSIGLNSALSRNKPELVLDRLHTFSTKLLRQICEDNGITTVNDKGENFPLHSLAGMLKKKYEQDELFQSSFTAAAIQNSISLFDKYNAIRNNQSYAHDNPILGTMEAEFAVRIMADVIVFLDKAETYRKQQQKSKAKEEEFDFDVLF